MHSPVRIAIVYDDQLHGQCLAEVLPSKGPFHVLTLLKGVADIHDQIQARPAPDVLLVDWDLPGQAALALTDQARQAFPGVKVLVIGLDLVAEDIQACIRAGCAGLVLRHETLDDLVARIEGVLRGEAVCPPRVTGVLFSQVAQLSRQNGDPGPSHPNGLTAREEQVLDLIREGLSNKQIARRLGVSLHTVKNHIHNLLGKLDVESRHEAASIYKIHSSH